VHSPAKSCAARDTYGKSRNNDLGKIKCESDTIFNAAERRKRNPSQRRVHYELFAHGCDLVAFYPRVSGESAFPGCNRDPQREASVLNRGDRHDADIQCMPIQRVVRDNQGWTVFIDVYPVDLSPSREPSCRNSRHASVPRQCLFRSLLECGPLTNVLSIVREELRSFLFQPLPPLQFEPSLQKFVDPLAGRPFALCARNGGEDLIANCKALSLSHMLYIIISSRPDARNKSLRLQPRLRLPASPHHPRLRQRPANRIPRRRCPSRCLRQPEIELALQ